MIHAPDYKAIVTELAVNGDLKKFLLKNRLSLSDAVLMEMTKDIVKGMMYLHGLRPTPILHRDLTTQV